MAKKDYFNEALILAGLCQPHYDSYLNDELEERDEAEREELYKTLTRDQSLKVAELALKMEQNELLKIIAELLHKRL